MKKILIQSPFSATNAQAPWEQGKWPASWICAPNTKRAPVVMLFELNIMPSLQKNVELHIAADERYILSVNGAEEGRGNEPGNLHNWFYDTYSICLKPGNNTISVLVWAAGEIRSLTQISSAPGMLLATNDSGIELSSGIAGWRVKTLESYKFLPAKICWGRGNNTMIDGKIIDEDNKQNWKTPEILHHAQEKTVSSAWSDGCRLLTPSTLPSMENFNWTCKKVRFSQKLNKKHNEKKPVKMSSHNYILEQQWQDTLNGKSAIRLEAQSIYEIIIDMEDYVCAYNSISISGGKDAHISLEWAEALFEQNDSMGSKGNRNEIENKYFIGEGDRFISGGGKSCDYKGLWWHAGRYLKIRIETSTKDLFFEKLDITHTSYPFKVKAEFHTTDNNLKNLIPLMIKSLRMCSHETLMDCPYYEQMMYVGDSRLENLIFYVLCDDDRLPRKSINMFNLSREAFGSISSRYPTRAPQHIPGFDLMWIGMVYDFALWRGDKVFVKQMMPGVRGVINYFFNYLNDDNMLVNPPGWKFMDWVPEWEYGIPPASSVNVSPVLNWLMIYTLELAAKLEDWFDEKHLAIRYRLKAKLIFKSLHNKYWSELHNMYADDLEGESFSEHSQSLAILSGILSPERESLILKNIAKTSGAVKTTVYFSHYLFEAAYKLKMADIFFCKLKKDWFYLPGMGLKTICERPFPSRSDCHAWGAHPLYHYYASIMGIRPKGLGSTDVLIKPMPGDLEYFKGIMPFQGKFIKATGKRSARH